jgi:hypothetical protein
MFPNVAIHVDQFHDIVNKIRPELALLRTQRILIVVDGGIALAPGGLGFGVSKIAAIIDGADFGFARTRVVLATRDGAQNKFNLTEAQRLTQATYTGFRFNQNEPGGGPTLHQFDQVWCFGIRPVIHNPTPADDAAINQSTNNPTSDAEAAFLKDWMDSRMGGVLAMGDHAILGASMCSNIPRVRRMRRWKASESVPHRTGTSRHDTNRPATAAQTWHPVGNPFPAVIPNGVETDANPQPLEWVPESSFVRGLRVYKRPHPILCHPEHGPIDVFPDHPHEGWCYDTHEINNAGNEFPQTGSNPPMPRSIAHVRSLPDPPWNFEKGDQPGRKFSAITIYDGQRISLGRVVVDSTWHHWFDMNIAGLEAENGVEWAKIRRYFVNVAIWLAKPGWRARMLEPAVVALPLTYAYLQELDVRVGTAQLGRDFANYLYPLIGPCWVSEWLFDLFAEVPRLIDFWHERWPVPDPCLSCPPWPLMEDYLLGHVARAALRRADAVHQRLGRDLQLDPKDFEIEGLLDEARRASLEGMGELARDWQESLDRSQKLIREMQALAERGAKAE